MISIIANTECERDEKIKGNWKHPVCLNDLQIVTLTRLGYKKIN